MQDKINIVFISDNNYAANTAVAIMSLKHNRDKNVQYQVYLISEHISEDNLNKIRFMECEKFHIEIIENTIDISTLPPQHLYVTPASLLRFFLAEYLCDLNKVLYIDGDVIIQDDLVELYHLDLENYYAAAVRDIMAEKVSKPNILEKLHSNLTCYFNAGIMLINLKRMRKENSSEKLIEYVRSNHTPYYDQDALNIVFNGEIKYLPCKYNYMIELSDHIEVIDKLPEHYGYDREKTEQERLQNVCVIHMAGGIKPWNIQVPYITDIFMKYYKMSPFGKDDFFHPQKQKIKQFLFPFELIPKDSRIVIWGAGKVGCSFYQQIKYTNYCNIVLWVDNLYEEYKKAGLSVSPTDMITRVDAEYIVIAVKDEGVARKIKEEITRYNIQKKDVKMIWRYPVLQESVV